MTSVPVATTTPANSCPGMIGSDGANSPSRMCRSVPQIPQAATSTTTSRGPGAGSSTLTIADLVRLLDKRGAHGGITFPGLYFTAPMDNPRTSLSCAAQPASSTGRQAMVAAADRWARNGPSGWTNPTR